ncbi:sodium/hydrogen exchanger 3-like isoform X3 [Ischnura elegans]|uniref:sodium/hydrogen exchanger 3-like isoform X3 n=1 Tax=Ischnura elegans TaxID=197161 RepID=UPI001ED86745|nr:sodium/hydrogen exchanger 3-like isoform X3 [Ischnura elegans]
MMACCRMWSRARGGARAVALLIVVAAMVIEVAAADSSPVVVTSPVASPSPPALSMEAAGSTVAGYTEGPSAAHHGDKKVKRYPVASVEFARVETPFIIGLWIFCASLAKIGFHMAPKLSKMFPESCLLITVGVAIGVLLFHTTNAVHVSPLTPNTFFLYMLPPIILDAGYFMPNRLFFDHLGTILLFAVVGTIFNTLTIGASLWAVGQSGLYGVETPLLEMLLFAALISAVDPVAVLAVFEEIHVNEILYIVVFGESLLNDAVTVVLYDMFEAYVKMGPGNILYTDILSGFASFLVVAVGGTIIGVIWGLLTGFVTRFTNQVRVIEPIFIFVMAYLAYLNAEIFHMSGILAITFCGITMKNYVEANISHKSHTTVKYAMKMLSSSSETVIFMFLGVATVNDKHAWNTPFVLLTILFCSVFRAASVILLSAVANRFRLHKLERVEKFVMSYGGLRGAVAFALVLLIDKEHVHLQPMFVTTTIAVIYFTVFFQGITIKPLVKILNVKRAEKRKPTMNERIHERCIDHVMAGIEDILGHHGNYHVRDKFKHFDNRYLRQWLVRDHKGGAEPKILETYSKLTMKDAMEFMRRNASTINMTGTESMSALFRNYTAGGNLNMNGRNQLVKSLQEMMENPTPVPGAGLGRWPSFRTSNIGTQQSVTSPSCVSSASFSQLDTSMWNLDLQELEYNPSKKDLTDARIHHLLAEELCKPYRRHRRLSYSRHAVNDRDLSTQVNYKMHMNIRRMVSENVRKHHHKRSKRLGKDPDDDKTLCSTSATVIIPEILETIVDDIEDSDSITSNFFLPKGPELTEVSPDDGKVNHVSFPGITQNGSAKQFSHDYINEMLQESDNLESVRGSGKDDTDGPITFTAKSSGDGGSTPIRLAPASPRIPRPTNLCPLTTLSPFDAVNKPSVSDYDDSPTVAEVSLPWRRGNSSSDDPHVTPTATETLLPWKRDDEADMGTFPIKQREFPPWCTNKEYLAHNSPSATFLGGLEQPKVASVIGLFRRENSEGSGEPLTGSTSAVLLIEEGPFDEEEEAAAAAVSSSSKGSRGMPSRHKGRKGSGGSSGGGASGGAYGTTAPSTPAPPSKWSSTFPSASCSAIPTTSSGLPSAFSSASGRRGSLLELSGASTSQEGSSTPPQRGNTLPATGSMSMGPSTSGSQTAKSPMASWRVMGRSATVKMGSQREEDEEEEGETEESEDNDGDDSYGRSCNI